MTYRPDVDGLRAVAVLPVLFFHAGVWPFSGGYVGVDVFFVISGYLITSLILRETEAGTFSYWDFLERRIRRLLPASIPVILATLVAGWFLLIPDYLVDLGRSTYYLFLFAANHFFLGQAGYFDATLPAPLLHTWSLSVEEQFYLVYAPVLVLILRYAPRYLPGANFLTVALSFAFAAWMVGHHDANEAFFLAAPRVWELLAGGALAFRTIPRLDRMAALLCRVTGLALIAFAVFSYDAQTAFPGMAALPPVVGAMLVIVAGAGVAADPLYRLLASRPAAYLGKISYSLYLWHYPLLVYAKLFGPTLPGWYVWPVLAVSVALAALSFRYVETPFRRGRLIPSRSTLFAGTIGTGALFVCSGVMLEVTHGYPPRLPQSVRTALSFTNTLTGEHVERCLYSTLDTQVQHCLLGADDRATLDFVLWGDSHAYAMWPGFDALARSNGAKGVLLTFAACAPFFDVGRGGRDDACLRQNRAAERFIASQRPRFVVLQANWTAYARREMLQPAPDFAPASASAVELPAGEDPGLALFRDAFMTTVDRLRADGARVFVVDAVPVYSTNIPNAVALALLFDRGVDIGMERSLYDEQNAFAHSTFERLAEVRLVTRIRLVETLCPRDQCRVLDEDGVSIYADESHLTLEGARVIEPALRPIFDGLARSGS